jgi:hypothetical protein
MAEPCLLFDMDSHTFRFRPDQSAQIREARKLRQDASDLRSLVSQGSYGNEELTAFYRLTNSAGNVLEMTNPELSGRVGLGPSFFSSVSRDGRRPKLANFLRALTAIIDVANERLFDIDNASVASSGSSPKAPGNSRLQEDHIELLALSTSLSQMARWEIETLDAERPNDPETIAKNEKQRELLEIFADGFEKIAHALVAFAANPNEPILLGKAGEIVTSVGNQVTAWWKENGTEVVDWAVRLPAFVGGIAALGWAGASMGVATTAVAALVGGDKVMKAIKGGKQPK